MQTMKHLRWSSANHSHVGMVRKINEDSCLALPELGLWAVADGMGGHEAGDVASGMIIDALRQIPIPLNLQDFTRSVSECVEGTNRQLRSESAQHYSHRTIGSTVVILLACADRGACLWVGDSRLYRLRSARLEQLTRDHSHVQDLIEQGILDPEEAHQHPLSNVITRAVGSADRLDIDVIEFALQEGDLFLLCSDGLNKVLTDAEIAQLMSQHHDQELVQALIQSALARGASDNVTVVVVEIDS
jgi:serine/threonine protein phosphatase PrpC